jgi:hypothetical protein
VDPKAASREELDVFGVRSGPAALDVMHPERVEPLGDAELVRHREIDAFALRTVAQGRVIDFDLWFHVISPKNGGQYPRIRRNWQIPKQTRLALLNC